MDSEKLHRADSSAFVADTEDQKMPSTLPDHKRALAAEIAAMSPEEYRVAERKLVRKIDKNLIPWMTLLYLMSFLDRVNIGTAKLTGLTAQLKLTSLQYSNASMIFFVSYVAFEVPGNLVLKRFRPSRWIPFTMICWSIFQIFMGLVTNYGQLLALRFCLGLFESSLFPSLNMLLSYVLSSDSVASADLGRFYYRRDEINRRCAIFFAGAVLAGAFGGIFGYAWSRMNGVGGKEGWTWIFIFEGILTLIVAILSFWFIHDWPEQARFLTPLEKELLLVRMKQDQGLAGEGTFSKKVVFAALKDYKTYVLMLMYIGAAEPLYSGSLFSPTIIAALGHWSVTQSLLLSTPPYVCCFISTLATAWYSDKYRQRAFPLMFWSVIAIIGYVILLSVSFDKPGVLYFAVFVTTTAVGPLIATTIAWTGNTFGNHYKKAVSMGLVFSAGNSGGIVSSEAYRNKDAPRFIPGHATAIAFAALCFSAALLLHITLSRENKRRDRVYGPPPQADEVYEWDDPATQRKWGLEGKTHAEIVALGDDHPAFRYFT
ncbi:hypothetical protein TREMEDRAFT_44495 [Tremella mesenterica DSM 1558]|uniref:uncharacterized protein n=1 Tax=Tremella mesenterica (strain ATCC 24925 / CBS 8224 / DSM 1558 / NBRC 9311 / NRRL Y-6157 / RJB 2259-6 / UBC 559-6) TaxID=578456 RepID=UPI0003F4925F|nr:uncharacterized protein TREMEDRAFT_44495 [Tremella mesenterica DSM 1558]EIW68677.1 hypothetical protein TREMEDRAFT_44495 [Tremella mesenterica DSM 1558]